MLKTGRDFLAGLREGRVVYVGGERVADVTAHPGFSGGARTLAALYDWKADPALNGVLSFAEESDRYSMWFLRPRSCEDLERRMRAHKIVADFSFGLFGRAPDHTGSTLTGLAMNPAVFDQIGPSFGVNILRHYDYSRRNGSGAPRACAFRARRPRADDRRRVDRHSAQSVSALKRG
jgi:4-hydroxyphenylacetate 3-monooxygenase